MRRILLSLLAVLVCLPAGAEDAFPEPRRERIEWVDIWFTDAEKDALPRVLLIGDSITRGYFDGVEKALDGRAYCGRLTSSRSVCDPVFFQELALVLGQYPFAVIHFNNGLHGWDYTEEHYRAGFQRLVDLLREKAPGAKLICGLTTPVQEQSGMSDHAARVAKRNAIATEICAAANIPLNDLHAAAIPGHFSPDGVHFNNDGKAAQTKLVADAVKAVLAAWAER